MPTKATRSRKKAACPHSSICTTAFPQTAPIAHVRPTSVERKGAQDIGKIPFVDDPWTYPPPLLLPDDDLTLDDPELPQSFQEWRDNRHRNKIVPRRKTVYLVPPPEFDDDVKFTAAWIQPHEQISGESTCPAAFNGIDGVAAFVRAFYSPLPVRVLPSSNLRFVGWSATDTIKLRNFATETQQINDSSMKRPHIGLQTPAGEVVGVRCRPTPHYDYPAQVNQNDVLDAVISALPTDAYAICMLLNHDMYEDEDDEFCCGRAYGGSRVSVVSTARYNPTLDRSIELDLEHVWPLSHCSNFIASCFRPSKKRARPGTSNHNGSTATENSSKTPLQSAVSATLAFRANNIPAPSSVWLSRICRTVVHELGHCFGIAHCSYYACLMQGSATIKEDHRQPIYLCPVDLSKILYATGATEDEHLQSMLDFSTTGDMRKIELFAAMSAWMRARLCKSNEPAGHVTETGLENDPICID